ncbi:MAG: UrcA family protein [Pseudomonadota bacterium]
MTLPKTLATAIAATASLALLPAFAAETEQVKTLELSIADYDISNPADARAVVKKIERAARKVCTLDRGPVPLHERLQRERCEREAVANAVQSLNSDVVIAAFEETRSR